MMQGRGGGVGMLPGKMMGWLCRDAALLSLRINEEAISHSPQRTEPPEATETSKSFPQSLWKENGPRHLISTLILSSLEGS